MMKVLSYTYLNRELKLVFGTGKELKKLLDDDWKVIRHNPIDDSYRLSKPEHVVVEAINDDFNLEVLELREAIMETTGAKRLTQKMAIRFFKEIEEGKRVLVKEKGRVRSYVL